MSAPKTQTQDMMDGQGALFLGTHRYMLIRSDAFMGMFARLPYDERITAFGAIAASVRENGAKSAASYAGMGMEQAEKLTQTIMETAPKLGWGQWELCYDINGLELSVHNSPFVAGFGLSDHPVCAPICGMLEAVCTQIFGKSGTAVETRCASQIGERQRATAACHFRVDAKIDA